MQISVTFWSWLIHCIFTPLPLKHTSLWGIDDGMNEGHGLVTLSCSRRLQQMLEPTAKIMGEVGDMWERGRAVLIKHYVTNTSPHSHQAQRGIRWVGRQDHQYISWTGKAIRCLRWSWPTMMQCHTIHGCSWRSFVHASCTGSMDHHDPCQLCHVLIFSLTLPCPWRNLSSLLWTWYLQMLRGYLSCLYVCVGYWPRGGLNGHNLLDGKVDVHRRTWLMVAKNVKIHFEVTLDMILMF